ncbi:MAG TPA: WS/DGAT domain-containing protein, partial [Pseudolysinimonas sp.]|nr:WS/DGAT domain-containing protein [Pseudolysinimonas sp.]
VDSPILTRRVDPDDPHRWAVRPLADPASLVSVERHPDMRTEAQLRERAVDVLRRPLDPVRAMWRVVMLVAPSGGGAIVFAFHHGLTDGPGVLAALQELFGVPASPPPQPPGRRPGVRGLGLLAAVARRAPRSRLNRPIAAGFRLAVAEIPLDGLHAGARAAGATINDAALLAVAVAVHRLQLRAGEDLRRVVISVPVTAPGPGDALDRANRVNLLRIAVPTTGHGTLGERLQQLARATRRRKRWLAGDPAPALAPLFSAVGALGLGRHIVDRQRMITTILSDLHGPGDPLVIAGQPVHRILAVSPDVGNVPLVFVGLSYAGRFTVTVRGAPAVWNELDAVAADVRQILAAIADPAAHATHP